MCVPHGSKLLNTGKTLKIEKRRKKISKMSDGIFEKGDPDFVDERTSIYIPKKNLSLIDRFIKFLNS